MVNIIFVLVIVMLLLRLVIGINLLNTAHRNNLPNLNWLAFYFLVQATGLLFAPITNNPLADLPMSHFMVVGLASVAIQAFIIVFNQITFYQDRKSPALWFWAIFIVTTVIALYGVAVSESNIKESPWVAAYAPSQVLVWIWHGWAAHSSRIKVEKEKVVEDWVISRYNVVGAYSILFAIGGIAAFFRILALGAGSDSLGQLMGLIGLLVQLLGVPLQFLAWVMPVRFRNWLNRNQQAHTEENRRQQAMAILDIVGSAMADSAGMGKIVALFEIRKRIGARFNTEDQHEIEQYLKGMSYNDWQAFLNDPELYAVMKGAWPNTDPQKTIDKAKQALVERQSLFTMQSR